jgi:hypothetical protein
MAAAQLSLNLSGYELMQAVRSAAKLTHKAYGENLTPVKHCLARLFDREVMALSRFLAFEASAFVDAETGRTIPAPDLAGLKAAVIAEQPERIAARQRDLSSAVLFEMEQYGCILLAANPYHMPQMYAEERKAA